MFIIIIIVIIIIIIIIDTWIMQFESLHWISHHGLWVILPCSTNMVGERVIVFGSFVF